MFCEPKLSRPPCVLFEDEHLLVVNKPAGMNTHAPGPFAGEGIYDWLRHREPRWADLAIIHRLDKETSGVMVFGKTALANRSLTAQFTERTARKKYVLLTGGVVKRRELVAKSGITRIGDRFASAARGEPAETRFKPVEGRATGRWELNVGCSMFGQFNMQHSTSNAEHPRAEPPYVGRYQLIAAEPLTGRTHQIRVQAAENGFPVLGDTLYGGAPFARLCLHAEELTLQHPASDEAMSFCAPVDFFADARLALRAALIDPQETDVFRIIHGASDGWPGWYVDRLGSFFLSQSERGLNNEQKEFLQKLMAGLLPFGVPPSGGLQNGTRTEPGRQKAQPQTGAYHKILKWRVRGAAPAGASPQFLLGKPVPAGFTVRENGLQFELSFNEGYSVGLFLDQRDNRRRLLTGHVAADFPLFNSKFKTQNSKFEVLNCYAYTCGFSVCAAKAGARTTSLDLSKKYLEWGKRNFVLNGLDPAGHEFIYGDGFDWLRRLAKKGRSFDVVLLDPPTFSQSKKHGVFRVEKDFPDLVGAALTLLRTEGVLFASTNAAGWPPERFVASVERAVHGAKRKIVQRHYAPQPPDFPASHSEPAYLKTVWMGIR